MNNTDFISLGRFVEKHKTGPVSPNVVKTSLKIAGAAGFDISGVTSDTYPHVFGDIPSEVIEQSLDSVINSPPLSLPKASTLYTSHTEKNKDQIKVIVETIGTIEMISVFTRLESIWSIGAEGDEVQDKYHNTQESMLSTHNALQNLKHIIEVADFLSRHDF